MKYTYWYITGQKISKKTFNSLVKRYGIIGDDVKEGKTTIAYRREKLMSEAEKIYAEGRA